MTEIAQAMAVLDDAFRRCRKEDIRTPDVFAALDYLEAKSVDTWPFDQFRFALDSDDPEARWQNLNASLNGIRRVVSDRPRCLTISKFRRPNRSMTFSNVSRRNSKAIQARISDVKHPRLIVRE